MKLQRHNDRKFAPGSHRTSVLLLPAVIIAGAGLIGKAKLRVAQKYLAGIRYEEKENYPLSWKTITNEIVLSVHLSLKFQKNTGSIIKSNALKFFYSISSSRFDFFFFMIISPRYIICCGMYRFWWLFRRNWTTRPSTWLSSTRAAGTACPTCTPAWIPSTWTRFECVLFN